MAQDGITNFNPAFEMQSTLTKRLIDGGKQIANVIWFEVESPSMIETRIFGPMECSTSRMKLQIQCMDGHMVSVSFDIDKGECVLDQGSFMQTAGVQG